MSSGIATARTTTSTRRWWQRRSARAQTLWGVLALAAAELAVPRAAGLTAEQVCVLIFLWVFTLPPTPSSVLARSQTQVRDGKVDVVYTWVTDEDPAWMQAWHEVRQDERLRMDHEHFNHHTNHDELKYSLRSLHKHMVSPRAALARSHYRTLAPCPPCAHA